MDEIQHGLGFEIGKVKKNLSGKRRENIIGIRKIDVEGLKHGDEERRIRLHETAAGEEIHIQIPGKGSVSEKNPKPWDFKPVVKINGELFRDMSLKDCDFILPVSWQSEQNRFAYR